MKILGVPFELIFREDSFDAIIAGKNLPTKIYCACRFDFQEYLDWLLFYARLK